MSKYRPNYVIFGLVSIRNVLQNVNEGFTKKEEKFKKCDCINIVSYQVVFKLQRLP